MKQSDDLQLVAAGTMTRPGVIGRAVRAGLFLVCVYVLYSVVYYRESIIETPVSAVANFVPVLFGGFFVFNYVVNIGFGHNWGRKPVYVLLSALAIAAALNWAVAGTADGSIFGLTFWLWLIYVYAHLGISFLLAALIATPGCEMRAIPELYGRMTDQDSPEHHSPAAFIRKIDDWERGRANHGADPSS